MIDQTTAILETIKESTVVKRVSQSQFVKSRILVFEKFLERILFKTVKKVMSPLRKKMNALNWILINCVVIAYFLGKTEASNLNHLQMIYSNYSVIGLYTIFANAIAAIAIGLGTIIRYAVQIVLKFCAILLAVFAIYWIIKVVWDYLTGKCRSTEVVESTVSL